MPATAPTRTTIPAGTRRFSPRLWIPNQHGAWAMLLLPLLVGSLRAGPRPVHLWLGAAWFLAYAAFFATGVWLRSRLKPRYRPPVLVYGAATAVVGGGLLVAEPELARWAVVYAPLAAGSLAHSARRAERAFANDLLTVAATSLMAVVAYGLGRPDPGSWLAGAGHPQAWALAAASAAYLVGTAFYVKTMIRERGVRAWYVASVAYHVAVAATFAWWLPWVGAFLALVAVRAALVPRRRPGPSPLAIGIGEIVASIALGAVLLLVPLA
jgi:hypothetical protein